MDNRVGPHAGMFSKGRSRGGCLLKAVFAVLVVGGREGRGGGGGVGRSFRMFFYRKVWSHSTLTARRFARSGFVGQLGNRTLSILRPELTRSALFALVIRSKDFKASSEDKQPFGFFASLQILGKTHQVDESQVTSVCLQWPPGVQMWQSEASKLNIILTGLPELSKQSSGGSDLVEMRSTAFRGGNPGHYNQREEVAPPSTPSAADPSCSPP